MAQSGIVEPMKVALSSYDNGCFESHVDKFVVLFRLQVLMCGWIAGTYSDRMVVLGLKAVWDVGASNLCVLGPSEFQHTHPLP